MSSTTMPATAGHNEACCNIPPVVSEGYKEKGTYEDLGGYKTYVTGPTPATKAIVSIYDIFGYFPQTLQGADILATNSYRVFMPDLFAGQPASIEWYPPDTPEKQQKLSAFFAKHPPPDVAPKIVDYVKQLRALDANQHITQWAVMGYCWGGKVVTLITSAEADSNPFAAAAVAHPAMVDPADAPGIKVPFALLASMEEPADKVEEFRGKLTVPNHVETFADQVHGWMAARADLENARVKEEYTRGYCVVAEFFAKYVK